ncbi:MAG: sugar ABC transporter permease [Candidatus Marinimicrobia bacterium]|nr:sugar ABC transporter permease [Candidatus Neomarinimicrobiota bacterium]TFB11429.1 sugar ABC transporter permease [Candidatus Marinimicrobia bacterium MT.SAG.2]
MNRKLSLMGYLMSAPYIIYFIIFSAFPIFFSFFLIFHRWNIVGPMKWVGLANFNMMFSDPLFWTSIYNTIIFLLIHIPLQVVVALVLAEVLNQKIKARAFFRAAFFMPVVVSGVVVTILWKQLYSTDTGLLNNLLMAIGFGKVEWLTSTAMAMPSIALMATWKNVGLYMILFLAGLQSVPAYMYEAADIDGATTLQKFRYITIPAINPVIIMVLILSTIGGFSLFIEPYVMTGGGPLNSTLSTVLYIYRQGFSFYKMGYAATLGFMLAAIIFVVVLIQRKLIEQDD